MRTVAGSRIRFVCCSVILSATLAACGGGSGASTSAQTDTSTPPVTTTPVALAPTNNAPKIAGTAQTSAIAGQAYQFKPNATDADQDTETFSIANKPVWFNDTATT